MRNFAIILVLFSNFTYASLSSESTTPSVKVTKHGLTKLDANSIEKEGSEFPYQENGICVVAGKNEPCMQWGFVLSWSDAKPGTKMACIFSANQPAKIVNHLSASSIDEPILQEISITFTKRSGTQLIPAAVMKEAGDTGIFTQRLKCRVDNSELINLIFSINLDTRP